MASLTVRQLDEALKQQLRLRAARHGRSVEDEVRTILREAAGDTDAPPAPAGLPLSEAPATKPRVLLIVGGGIAAYKSLDLIRRLKERRLNVRCILTKAAEEFITALSASAVSGERVFTDLFDPAHEFDVGHIRLAREADLIVVAPATADLMAKMAAGIADDLGTTMILATDKPVLVVPAMNVKMWQHAATQRNVEWLKQAGVHVMQPDEGEMACGEFGPGRLPEPEMVWLEIAALLGVDPGEAGAREVAEYLEALEPEEEPEGGDGKQGGLAGLLASIIPRSTARVASARSA